MVLSSILKSVNNSLVAEFTNCGVYTRDTTEGYTKPCFFTELNLDNRSHDNCNYDSYTVQITITYIDTKRDDVTLFDIEHRLETIFDRYIKVGERVLPINSFDINYVGDNEEQLECVLYTSFLERFDKTDTNPVADSVETTIKEI